MRKFHLFGDVIIALFCNVSIKRQSKNNSYLVGTLFSGKYLIV